MSERTGIAWTDHTFNPWWGCAKVSPGCKHCYAEALDRRLGGAHFGGRERKTFGPKHWADPIRWDKAAAKAGRPALVFCASMGDVFDVDAPSEERRLLWELIRKTPNLIWQLLTKRPENIPDLLPHDWHEGYPNVWLGATVEDREHRRRIDELCLVPARLRFLSCEPLLEDLGDLDLDGIGWVITGGESGPCARPAKAEWIRDIDMQCQEEARPHFFKQWGQARNNPLWAETSVLDRTSARETDLARIDPHGKGGALLDGRLIRQFPALARLEIAP